MIGDNNESFIANYGEKEPQNLTIPDRDSDFPSVHLPVAEEARVHAINRLYPSWVEQAELSIVVRINDDLNADAWLVEVDDGP